ncbi:LLM class flavin-dependent oxidoreductase [Actinopolymorpha sp. B11F2]|uniref:LLM class flavin-dependent oxidoreductase n=1 Tax=Actinopolymorpha sp. B11F2 TaxID=3160862 RepID=UPI0032E386B0
MPDYRHDLRFGVFLSPSTDQVSALLALADGADRRGLDLISVQDHPYHPGFLDAWTLLSTIAARTNRATVFPNVANLPLRDPAVLARSAASLDILSGGRVELGLGAGAMWDAIAAMGGPRRKPGEAVEALTEAIAVIRALWTPGRGVRLEGSHYRLAGAKPGPFPVHPMQIWLGAYKPRMLRLTGRAADGWLPSQPYAAPDTLAAMNDIIDDAAEAAGRSPGAVRRLYNITGSFTGTGAEFLQGPPSVWVEQLAELAVTDGISGFILAVEPGGSADVERFAHEVAPAVRDLVDRERAGSPPAGTPPTSTRPTGTESTSPESTSPESTSPESTGPESTGTESTEVGAADNGPTGSTSAEYAGETGLGVVPTPPPAQRLVGTSPWDESTRPHGPGADADTSYTPAGRAQGQHLIDIHDHLRHELDQVRGVVEQVADGTTDPRAARSLINAMTMRQNNWTLGAYCQSYCRILTLHHSLEDQAMFPGLRQADTRLAPVIDRLAEEHEVIARILNDVDAALVAMVERPGAIGEVQHAVDVLTDALLSHLSYEERELVEPLARLSTGFTGM